MIHYVFFFAAEWCDHTYDAYACVIAICRRCIYIRINCMFLVFLFLMFMCVVFT